MSSGGIKHSYSDIARRLASIGILSVPVSEGKRSTIKWREVTLSNIDDSYWQNFEKSNVQGLAVVSGKRSGGIEVIDVDSKYDITGTLFDDLVDNIMSYSHDLFLKLVMSKTPSGGYHIIYRVEDPKGNMKLARRRQTLEEFEIDNNEHISKTGLPLKGPTPLVLLETRGEGGYFLGWPSPGYSFLPERGNWGVIQSITTQERDALFEICRSFDQMPVGQEQEVHVPTDPVPVIMARDSGYEPTYKARINKGELEKYKVTPWDDFNYRCNVIDLLVQYGWSVVQSVPSSEDGRMVTTMLRPGKSDKLMSGTYNYVPGKFWCFSTSTSLPDNKPLAAMDILVHIAFAGNFRAALTYIESQGFGELNVRNPNPAVLSTTTIKPIGQDLVISQAPPVVNNVPVHGGQLDMAQFNDRLAQSRGVELNTWWENIPKVKRDGSMELNPRIIQHKLISWLDEKGLRCRRLIEGFQFVLIEGIVVSEVNKKQITNIVVEYIATLPARFDFMDRSQLLELFIKGVNTYLDDLKLSMVRHFDEDMLMRDTRDEAYVPFKNGVLTITKSGCMLVEYSHFHQYIWKDAIKDFSYTAVLPDDVVSHEFNQFLYNIAGREYDRHSNLLQLIGYCLHTYKDPAFPAAVILCDSKISDRAEGGTGKGLLVKAISYIRSTVYEDGRMGNKRNQGEFRFSRIKQDSNILHISDVERNYDFEALFTLITEGMPIRKLYTQEIFIPYEKSPKVILSTNYSVSGRGSAHDRRRIEFELADHYSARKTPYAEFGHHFFDDWDVSKWNSFYALMADCITRYLRDGKPTFAGINIDMRKFRDETSNEFTSWFFGKFGTKSEIEAQGPRFKDSQASFHFNSLYMEFLTFAGLERTDTRPSKFFRYMVSGCSFVGLEISEDMDVSNQYSGTVERKVVIRDVMRESRNKRIESAMRSVAKNSIPDTLELNDMLPDVNFDYDAETDSED